MKEKIERGVKVSMYPHIYDRCLRCGDLWKQGKYKECPRCKKEND